MIYNVGCDMAKDEFAACLLAYELTTQDSNVHSRKTFKNNLSGAKAFLNWIARHTKGSSAQIRCTMEATGIYHELLALHIFEKGETKRLLK